MNDSELCRKIVKNKLDPMSMYTQLRFMKNSFVIACLVMGTVVPSIVQAQSAESLDKRITAVEKQLNAVQRRVFRGETGAGTQMSPRPDVTATGVSLADMQARIAEIETQLRILTGQVEESNYRFNRLQQQYEKFTQDVEFRFTALEKNKGTAAAGSDHTQPPSGGTENVTAEVHVSPPVDITVADNSSRAPADDALPKTAKVAYEQAYGYVRMGQYSRAEAALSDFLTRYPDDELTGNAKYWLGQVHFVQKHYEQAAMTFLEGYKAHPDHTKAPSFLLKIGMTLGVMGEKFEACEAFKELQQRFPKSDESQKRLPGQLTKFGCD
ncbi:MAG: tol-pal system protein YbgF [Kordiimonas sp.]|nr:tol-pal system protein YbgF [Kordiimonas sp.]